MNNKYYFAIMNHPDEEGYFCVAVVKKETWENESRLDDFLDDEIRDVLVEYELYEIIDSIFEYSGDMNRKEMKTVLTGEGLFYSEALEDWLMDFEWE